MFNNIFIHTEYESRWIWVDFPTQQQTYHKNEFYIYQNILYINVYSLLGSSCFHFVIYDVVRVYFQYLNIFYLNFVHWWFISVYSLCFSHSLFGIFYVVHRYHHVLNVFYLQFVNYVTLNVFQFDNQAWHWIMFPSS